MSNIIEFIPSSKLVEVSVEPPIPAKDCLPQWYQDLKIFSGDNYQIENGSISNITVKACKPFSDALTSGYIQKSWCDIDISIDSFTNSIKYNFSVVPEIMSMRPRYTTKILDYFYPFEFTWLVHWMPKLPKGWSALITHPFNRYDLPFLSTTGIIDSDKFYHSVPGSYPFYIKNNFTGIIPAGTPMYQIIPIKRESWSRKNNIFDENEYLSNQVKSRKHFFGTYKKYFHVKKIYH